MYCRSLFSTLAFIGLLRASDTGGDFHFDVCRVVELLPARLMKAVFAAMLLCCRLAGLLAGPLVAYFESVPRSCGQRCIVKRPFMDLG